MDRKPRIKTALRAVIVMLMMGVVGVMNIIAQESSPTGAIDGLFSVGENQQVYFSKGNLQYRASTNTWRFANHQFDFVGGTLNEGSEYAEVFGNVYENGIKCSNNRISSDYSGWIDLFGWGTSGYNHGANSYQPWSTSQNNSDYYVYNSSNANLYDNTGQADWGYNAISNGGNQENQWRTLTGEEWRYVLYTRNTASNIRFAKAKVNYVEGLIILPDDWNTSIYALNNPNDDSSDFSDNIISEGDWTNVLEANGAVFLPAAGDRDGTDYIMSNANIFGLYWSASRCNWNAAYSLNFADGWQYTYPDHAYYFFVGLSVRLVCPSPVATTYNIEAIPNPASGGTAIGSGTYEEGQTCTLIATANEGFTFVNWTKDGTEVSTESEYSFVVTENAAFVTNFRETNITFSDFRVKALCVANWDTNGDGELSYAEAAAVTDLGEVFKNKTNITNFDELQYFTGLTAIGDFAFQRCLGLISIVIPNSVISIGNSAFSDCTSLTSIIIPDSVTSIGICAFLSCYVLPSIEIPHSITSIGSGAFGECEALTSIEIPNTVTSIGSEVLAGCGNLTQIVVEEGNPIYDSRDNCNAIIETATNCLIAGCKNTIIPNSVTSIGNYAFHYCYGLNSIEIPNSVTDIGEQAFAYCPDLTTVLIGDSVTTIMWGAFLNCDALTSIEIPNSVTSIGSNVFWNCDALSQIIVEDGNPVYDSRDNCNAIIKTATNSLIAGCQSTVIPNSVISIGFDAFNYCSSLTAITIPSSVVSIGNYAFYYCSGLTSITVMSDTPPEFVLNNVTNGVFEGVDKSIPVYVPCNSMSAYQAANGWNEFTNYQEMDCPETTQSINLFEGWNWISTYIVADDPEAMLLNVEENIGENGLQIKSMDDYTTYDDGEWGAMGDLEEMYNEQMYAIEVSVDCTVTLQGVLANPEDYEIEINPGWNWIGFPCNEVVSLEDALANFDAEDGDQIKGAEEFSTYEDGEWGAMGDLEELVPGQGYKYFSASDETKTLIFNTGSKSRRKK